MVIDHLAVLGVVLAILFVATAPDSTVFTGLLVRRCRWWLLALGTTLVVCCGAR